MFQFLPKSLFTNLGISDADQRLPTRVRQRIHRQEELSEQMIGWVQLGLVITFGLLYLLSPKPADTASAPFQPVPIAIGLYLGFTIVRITLSYTKYLPGWLLVMSMIVDMTMLFGLIWSFHLQYEQPPAFYLKVPTFIYVFIFISVRALRSDHRFVLSAGLFAATGWLLMLAYAFHDDGMERVTQNFVEYLTGNYVLIGAEFDKVFAILLTTGILTYVTWRARKNLVSAVREETARQEIGRFLSEGIDETITGAEDMIEAGMAMERDVAIVMVDIRGFTGFSTNHRPREIVGVLTEFHSLLVPIIRDNNGVVDKFLGDGAMATFGAVKPSEHAAADALRALDQIMDAADSWRETLANRGISVPLDVNCAVVAGPTVFVALGSDKRLELTVIGEPVNLAAKLEKHNKAEEVRALTDLATYELARSQGYEPALEPEFRPAREVAGAPVPVDIVVLCKKRPVLTGIAFPPEPITAT